MKGPVRVGDNKQGLMFPSLIEERMEAPRHQKNTHKKKQQLSSTTTTTTTKNRKTCKIPTQRQVWTSVRSCRKLRNGKREHHKRRVEVSV